MDTRTDWVSRVVSVVIVVTSGEPFVSQQFGNDDSGCSTGDGFSGSCVSGQTGW